VLKYETHVQIGPLKSVGSNTFATQFSSA